jgi:hypothetical protein
MGRKEGASGVASNNDVVKHGLAEVETVKPEEGAE